MADDTQLQLLPSPFPSLLIKTSHEPLTEACIRRTDNDNWLRRTQDPPQLTAAMSIYRYSIC